MKIVVPNKVFQYFDVEGTELPLDKILYAVSLVYEPSYDQLEKDERYKRISATDFQWALGNNYKNYMEFLSEEGIIDINHSYEQKEYPKGYAIGSDWDSEPTIVEINDSCLCRKCLKRGDQPKYHTTRCLDRWIYDSDLTLEENVLSHFYPIIDYEVTYSQDSKSAKGRIYDIITIVKFNNRFIKAHRDATSGRYHSFMTTASKRVRPYFRYKGKELLEIDIRCCQPTLSLILFEDWFYEKESDRMTLKRILELDRLSGQVRGKIDDTILYKISKTLQSVDREQLKFYKALVLEGRLYEWIMEIMETELGQIITRDEAKESFCFALYSNLQNTVPPTARDKTKKHNEIKKLIVKRLPTLFNVFNQFKALGNEVLPILLQRVESYIIIDRVAKLMPRNIPFWTVHDSILTLKNFTEEVKKLIEEECYLATGLMPYVRVKGNSLTAKN